MEIFRTLEWAFVVVIIYIIYKVKRATHIRPNAKSFNNLVDGEIVGESPSNPYNYDNKQSVLSKLDEDISYFKDNDWPESFVKSTIENKELVSKAFDNPESKEKLIFHGGCLGCNSPKTRGIGRCRGCQYFIADWNLPDLSIN